MRQLDQCVDPVVLPGLVTKHPAKIFRNDPIYGPHPLIAELVLIAGDGKRHGWIGDEVSTHLVRVVAGAMRLYGVGAPLRATTSIG